MDSIEGNCSSGCSDEEDDVEAETVSPGRPPWESVLGLIWNQDFS